MSKRVVLTVIGLLAVTAALAGTKIAQFKTMAAHAADMKPPPATVATTTVTQEKWQPTFETLGTVVPVRGVELHAEVAGIVKRILFESGTPVRAGDALVLLDTSIQQAQLQSAEASAALGRSTLARISTLRGSAAISQSEVEGADAKAKQTSADVQLLQVQIGKRVIRAPFDGHLGIWEINLGQFLSVGDPINSVLALDPVHVDFTLPQQRLAELKTGMPVKVTSDAFPGEEFAGVLTAISPALDIATRAVQLRATLDNPQAKLRPGMFTHVQVVQPISRPVLVVPATAVIYAPYGDSIFLIDDTKDGKTARQAFVRLGERRGDFVEVTKGVTAGTTIVTTGAFKLRNGTPVVINNELTPETSLTPKPSDN